MPVAITVRSDVAQSRIGPLEVLLGQLSSTAGSRSARDGRRQRVGSVPGLHDQWEGVVMLLLLVVDSSPAYNKSATASFYDEDTPLTLRAHVVLGTQALHLLGQGSKVAGSHGSGPHPWTSWRRERRADPLDTGKVGLVVVERIGVRSSQSELSSLDILQTKRLPVEQLRQSLGPVSLVDTLPSGLDREGEHLVGLKAEVSVAPNIQSLLTSWLTESSTPWPRRSTM